MLCFVNSHIPRTRRPRPSLRISSSSSSSPSSRPSVHTVCARVSPPPSATTPPPAPLPVPPEVVIAHLKQRSVIALRGLGDFAGLALVAELSRRMLFIPCPNYALATDAELLLGGLVGLWTAAVFAIRTPFTPPPASPTSEASSLTQAHASDLSSIWDASFIYHPDIDADEIPAALAWLDAFNELEGMGTIQLLTGIISSEDTHMKTRLATALAAHPIRSNVTLSAILALAADSHPRTQSAALTALSAYCDADIVSIDSLPALMAAGGGVPEYLNIKELPVDDVLLHPDELALLKGVLNRIVSNPSPVPVSVPPSFDAKGDMSIPWIDIQWVEDVISRHVSSMRDAALTQPDLPDLPDLAKFAPMLINQQNTNSSSSSAQKMCVDRQPQQTYFSQQQQHFESPQQRQQQQRQHPPPDKHNDNNDVNVDVDHLRSAAPLVDSLVKEEIHGICALAMIPAAYEIFAAFQNELLPLRFLGLGWLLTVGGLAAYPNSAKLWSSFSLTIQRDAKSR